ncbi:beta-lactamase-like protein [Rhodocollybia butyracea]|uniref:Beta-lactamase-like protein n=1 Tax=Rhodocollybia butyracea TaxID=206335 RepID=A0A9P5TWU5_9AGAR|nr:beta-lactamase-like protein [Rhodocollybia butyracea]
MKRAFFYVIPTLSSQKSSSTVSVKAFNVCTPETNLPTGLFISPVKPGKEVLSVPDYAFLIEHPSGRKIMFDLGPLKDFSKLPPAMANLLPQTGLDIIVDKEITEQLQDSGVSVDEIDSIIWSHSHFDHTGDMSLFPSTVKLYIGKETDPKRYPADPEAWILESDFIGREVVELSWEKPDATIGGIPALDFFGDGSFYLMEVPGHWPGHLAGFARVKEDSFILLGADTCHHPGQLRPNPHIHKTFPCPGGILSHLSKPVLTLPEGFSFYADNVTSLASMEKVGILDAHPDVFLITAHDPSMPGIIALAPETLDNWKELGWKTKAAWAFLQEGNKGYGYC